ncbi:MAG TPA: hypothetical protein VME63_08995 [Dyella sp.]|uniref:hypothetical protein n=1 Tax=Dyella sp. TaxID=1869338 RepID=UPI002C942ABB|nr:hypothetical protein [Dyella sp.]HTV85531.1 hypothetical protein [Dyella sp.]
MTEGTVRDELYPAAGDRRVYRVAKWLRVAAVIATLALAGGANVMLFQPLWQGLNVPVSPLLMSVDVLFTLLMLYFLWWSFTAKVTLCADTIEESTPFGSRRLRKSEIKGCMRLPKGGGVLIAPKNGVPLTISKDSYNPDRYFDAWIDKLPDLKQVQQQEEEVRARNDPSLGVTPAQRLATYARRKSHFGKVYLGLLFASMAVFYVGVLASAAFAPAVFIAAAIPWCCLVAAYLYKDQWSHSAGGNNATAIIVPTMMPVLMLFIMASSRADLVDASQVMAHGALAGLPWLLAIVVLMGNIAVPLRQKLLSLLFLAALAWVYGGSLLALGNRMFDQSPPQVFRTHVVGWHVTHGKGGTHYYLELAGWGPEPGGTHLRVGYATYHAAHRGDPVCMGLHPGRLGFQWVHSMDCPPEGTP